MVNDPKTNQKMKNDLLYMKECLQAFKCDSSLSKNSSENYSDFRRIYGSGRGKRRDVTISTMPVKKNTYISTFTDKIINVADPTKKVELIRVNNTASNPVEQTSDLIKVTSENPQISSDTNKHGSRTEECEVSVIAAPKRPTPYYRRRGKRCDVTISAMPGKKNTYISTFKDTIINPTDPTRKIKLIR